MSRFYGGPRLKVLELKLIIQRATHGDTEHVAMVFLLKHNARVTNAKYAGNNSKFTEIHKHGFRNACQN